MEVIAKELRDTTLWSEALSRQASIDLMKGENYFPIAEQKLLDALVAVDKMKMTV